MLPGVIDDLADAAEAAGKSLRTGLLRRHADWILEHVQRHDITEADEHWIRERAARNMTSP
jgi:hypothetical protein